MNPVNQVIPIYFFLFFSAIFISEKVLDPLSPHKFAGDKSWKITDRRKWTDIQIQLNFFGGQIITYLYQISLKVIIVVKVSQKVVQIRQ